MTTKQILMKYLKDNGYDGLCGEYCGCHLNNFMPCDGELIDCTKCVPGYNHPQIAKREKSLYYITPKARRNWRKTNEKDEIL